MAFINLVFNLYFMYNLGIAELGTPSEQKCKRENNVTLTCNFIPISIPEGILYVVLDLKLSSDTDINRSTFVSSGWEKIKRLHVRDDSDYGFYLKFHDDCFNGLKALQELMIHVNSQLLLFSDTFRGIDNVNTLDMSGSERLIMKNLLSALNGSNILPQLTTLVLSNCSLLREYVVLDDTFVQVLQSKKISKFDASGLQVAEFDLTAVFKRMKYLEVMNMSYISVFAFTHLEPEDIKHIKTIDASYATLPKKTINIPPGKVAVSNISVNLSDISKPEYWNMVFAPEAVNFSGIVQHMTSIWIRNCTVKIDENLHLLTKEIIIRQNNLRRLDIIFICKKFPFSSALVYIDISENELEFLHPDSLSCFPNLQKLDLSKNKLMKMGRENISLFEILFCRLKILKHIKLSNNELTTIPLKMFENNGEIEVIDLSSNRLDQMHFILVGLKKLRVINLQGNNIQNLDTVSINSLNSIQTGNVKGDPHVTVILKYNPLPCSKCETKAFLTWLMTTNLVNVSSQKLQCSNENDLKEDINENTLDEVEKICKRKTIIIATSISAGVTFLILLIVLMIIYVQRKRASKLKRRENVLNALQAGEGSYEFAVFLSFSSDDDRFVKTYVLNRLNENLQLMTGIDRELVCTGDRHFRPGFYVHNEAQRRFDTASVLIAVISNNFCQSDNCQIELDLAYVMRKPIVLMFIDHIDQNVMTPTIRQLYQRNVRILWTYENGEYTLGTTWENVCTSILDLIH